MGGCRCYFRDCKVNTYKNPLMHFFRYPINDKNDKSGERYRKWREYSKQEGMLGYYTNRQKNCVVCSRHFRDECFMNYKKDRLTPTAIPTIHRLSINKALDYELDIENGVLVTLPEPQLEHLKPPPEFECPLGLENDETVWSLLRELEKGEVNEDVADELEGDKNMFLIDEIEDVAKSVARNSAHILKNIDRESPQTVPKRSVISLRNEEYDIDYSQNKRIKTVSQSQGLATTTGSDNIFLPKGTTIELDNLENNNPTIINHQIIEADGNIWIEQESYNIAGNGDFIEIQTNNEPQTVPSTESEKSSPPSENEDHLTSELSATEQWQANCLEMETANAELLEEKKIIERSLFTCKKENSRMEKQTSNLKSEIDSLKKENRFLKRQLDNTRTSGYAENNLKYQKQMEVEQAKYAENEEKLLQQINTLEGSLELVRQQLADTKKNLNCTKKDYANVQNEKIDLVKQQIDMDHQLQSLQEKYDNVNIEYGLLQKNHDILGKTHKKLKDDYVKLESKQNQVSTITTTNQSTKSDVQQTTTAVLTKAQLFNSIKRYISSSMVALLRMEMFGSSDREWKPDERQVAVDLLRLGESVYKYFTDEWRFRLPGLRDVRNWLSQSVDMDDEEDL